MKTRAADWFAGMTVNLIARGTQSDPFTTSTICHLKWAAVMKTANRKC
jgi:hypothetical protein